jgi:hypothetical protein
VGGYQPVYAPALVTFLGVGAIGIGVGAALAAGRICWVPLGPREPFHPWYHASNNYFRQVNVTHVTNFTTINQNVTINNFVNRGAATVVPASAMTASRPVASSFQRVDPAQLAQARPVIGQQPLRPTATTVGVTPAVARQLNLPAAPGFHAVAPGPAIHAAPVGLSTGVAAGAVMGHQVLPTLHNPAQPTMPAAAGVVHPFTAMPALRTPPAPGQIGPPAIIQHEPGIVNQGGGGATPATITHQPQQFHTAPGATFQQPVPPAIQHEPGIVNQGGGGATPATITHQPQQFHTAPGATFQQPVPPAIQHEPGIVNQGGGATPATITHQPQPFHTAPGATFQQPVPPATAHLPTSPPVVHTAPPVVHATTNPVPQFHAPPPEVHTPPPVMHTAPTVVHTAPSPPPVAHTPPPPQYTQHKKPGEQ